MRVRPAPRAAPLRGLDGRRLRRRAASSCARSRRRDALPDVIRLSDEAETRVSLGLAGDRGRQASAARRLPAAAAPPRRLPGDLRLGGRARVGRPPPRALGAGSCAPAAPCRSASAPGRAVGARPLRGPLPARRAARPRATWSRRSRPSHTWSRLDDLYEAVGAALDAARCEAQGTPGIVMCHLSHAYRDGASLYFTFIARGRRGAGDRAVARGRRRPPARRSSATGRHDHPPPRGRPRPRPLHAAPRSASWARGPAGAQGAPRPGRDHEPRQAAAGLAPPRRWSRASSLPPPPWLRRWPSGSPRAGRPRRACRPRAPCS